MVDKRDIYNILGELSDAEQKFAEYPILLEEAITRRNVAREVELMKTEEECIQRENKEAKYSKLAIILLVVAAVLGICLWFGYSSLNSTYGKAIEAMNDGNLIESERLFNEIKFFKDSSVYLSDATKLYLNGFWEDNENSGRGYGFSDEKFFIWKYKIEGLFFTEEYAEHVYEYPLNYYQAYQDENGELLIVMSVNNNGEDGFLTFKDLRNDSFTCMEGGAYTRYYLK